MEQPDEISSLREQRSATALALRVLDERIKIAAAELAAKAEPVYPTCPGCGNTFAAIEGTVTAGGKLWHVDCRREAAGMFFADGAWHMPKLAGN